jgi:hypothetical protein
MNVNADRINSSSATVKGRARREQCDECRQQTDRGALLTMPKRPKMAAMRRREARNSDDIMVGDIMVGYFRDGTMR